MKKSKMWCERMRNDLLLRGCASATLRDYLGRARRFAAHFRRSPEALGERHIRQYLIHLVRGHGTSPSTHAGYVSALKFLYAVTLARPNEVARIPYPRRPVQLPQILSGGELRALLRAIDSDKHRVAIMLAYGAGLRIAEIRALRPTDLDATRMVIHVRSGKGKKDRFVMLSSRLLACARKILAGRAQSSKHLFPGRDPAKPISANAIRAALTTAAHRSAIPAGKKMDVQLHCLHTGADLFVDFAADPEALERRIANQFSLGRHLGRSLPHRSRWRSALHVEISNQRTDRFDFSPWFRRPLVAERQRWSERAQRNHQSHFHVYSYLGEPFYLDSTAFRQPNS